MNQKFNKSSLAKKALMLGILTLAFTPVFATGINGAMTTATTTLTGSVSTLKTLIYAIGVIVGIVGGLRIYNKWTNGDQDINKEVVGWGGACLFLFVAPTFVDAIL